MSERLKKTLGVIVRVALLVLVAWFLVSHEQQMKSNIRGRDSTLYWATAKLLVHGGNPYSVPEILSLEQSEDYATHKVKMYRPPPWSTWMILPLGMLNAYWAWVVWTAVATGSFVIAVRVSWRMYGSGPNPTTPILYSQHDALVKASGAKSGCCGLDRLHIGVG